MIAITALAAICLHAHPAYADADAAGMRADDRPHPDATRTSSRRDATAAPRQRGAVENLVANGGFSQLPNPLAFWTNAPGASVTWLSEGANASQGAAQLRFLPPVSHGAPARGAIYYAGLTQCVPIPRSGRYLMQGFSRVSATSSPSSVAGLAWTLRFDSANCTGPSDGNGRVSLVRSTTWTASSIESIEIDGGNWTPATTVEVAVEVGDSSTASIEPVEASLDEISLVEGPLFADGFED
jgi:hypothetical protein